MDSTAIIIGFMIGIICGTVVTYKFLKGGGLDVRKKEEVGGSQQNQNEQLPKR